MKSKFVSSKRKLGFYLIVLSTSFVSLYILKLVVLKGGTAVTTSPKAKTQIVKENEEVKAEDNKIETKPLPIVLDRPILNKKLKTPPIAEKIPERRIAEASPGPLADPIATQAPTPLLAPSPEESSPEPVGRPLENIQEKTQKPARITIWGGVGANYITYEQKGSLETDSGSFAKLASPAYSLGAAVKASDSLLVRFEYFNSTFDAPTQEGSAIYQTSTQWKTLVLEGESILQKFGQGSLSLLYGVQDHQVPFLSDNGDGTASLLSSEYRNLSAGLRYQHEDESHFKYEILGHYQYPFATKSPDGFSFDGHSKTMLDGALGVSQRFENRYQVGLYYTAQYLDATYNFERAGLLSQGEQRLFNSTFELRFVIDFFP